MPDWTRSFVVLLESEAGIPLRMDGDRIVADFSTVPDAWADECAHLLTTYRAAIVVELRSRAALLPGHSRPETGSAGSELTGEASEASGAGAGPLW